MTEKITSLGDRLLARLVPHAKAAAVVCWYEYTPTVCVRRYCCTGSGIPAGYCTPWRPC